MNLNFMQKDQNNNRAICLKKKKNHVAHFIPVTVSFTQFA